MKNGWRKVSERFVPITGERIELWTNGVVEVETINQPFLSIGDIVETNSKFPAILKKICRKAFDEQYKDPE